MTTPSSNLPNLPTITDSSPSSSSPPSEPSVISVSSPGTARQGKCVVTSSPCRKRGGQPGNKNALKHGYYATVHPGLTDLSQAEPSAENLQKELAILHDFIRQLHLLTLATPGSSIEAAFTSLAGANLAAIALIRLRRAQLLHARAAARDLLNRLPPDPPAG